jgi:hypothetical protein
MKTMLAERLVRFIVGCETPKGEQYAVVHVYFPKKGGVTVTCPAGQGYHLTRKGGPANWAVWDFGQFLRDNLQPGHRIPTYLEVAQWADKYREANDFPGCRVGALDPNSP